MKHTYTEIDIPKIVRQILASSQYKTFLFYGKMGVGKTTLIKEFLQQLGVKEVSGSPTFSIVNEYEIPNDLIYHFDFYRIDTLEEAYDMGVEDYLYSGNYVFIEWPEKIESLLPEKAHKLVIERSENGERIIIEII